jgi:glycerol uptake facilitator-like aquaporin
MTVNFDTNWLYWIAPIFGAIIAAGVYKALHRDSDLPE